MSAFIETLQKLKFSPVPHNEAVDDKFLVWGNLTTKVEVEVNVNEYEDK